MGSRYLRRPVGRGADLPLTHGAPPRRSRCGAPRPRAAPARPVARSMAEPTRCPGWDVADVVLHLAQTDEMAVASLTDGPSEPRPSWTEELAGVGSVDEGAALLVARERGLPNEVLLERWVSGAAPLSSCSTAWTSRRG